MVTLPSHEAAVAAAYTVLLEYLSIEEASVEGNGIVGISAPAYKTAAAAGAGDDGAALAVGERDGPLAEAHEAANPVCCGVDFNRARAALDGDAAKEVADESSHAGVAGACVGSVDMSVDVEVDELGAARHLYEGGYELGIDGGLDGAVVECQRFVVAIEGAGEGVVAAARHLRHGDVGTEFHGLAAEVVPRGVVVEHLAEVEPVIGIINKVDVGAAGRQSNSGVIEVVVTDAVLIDGGTHEVEALCQVAYCSRGSGTADGLGAVGGDKVAVGQRGRYSVVNMADVGRGGTVVVAHGHGMERGGARCGAAVRAGEETVTEIDGVAVAPTLQATHIVAAVGDVTAIDGVAHVEGAVEGVAHDTATVVVASTVGGGDGDIGGHLAVGDGVHGGGIGATGEAHQSGGVYGADDAARHNEILDGSAFDFAEGCGALRRGLGDVDGECLSIAVEGAHELVARAARRLRDADVGTEFHGLAAEVVPRVVVLQGIAEHVPARGGVDGVLRAIRVDGEIVGAVGAQRLADNGLYLVAGECATIGRRVVV